MASSSSSVSNSQNCPRRKYDVFLSFRGDTRNNFTSHLHNGLTSKGIFTFLDDERLEDGDSISEELVKAIKESQVAVIVFSAKYATSSWCLNELVKIMECKEKENGHMTVIPIFYYVDPSDVRYQRERFAEAFTKHESRYKDDEGMQKVKRWKTALTAAAGLKGHDIHDGINQGKEIKKIVNDISSKLYKSACSLSDLQDVVGIHAHLENLKPLLQMEINNVWIVGIWGIGGIGKTTIANAIFDTLSNQFEASCFLANVKENAKKNQLHSLQNTLLSVLLRKKDDYVSNEYDGKRMIKSRLSSMKVLIVLDDIDHGDHLEYLAGDVGWFGNGSRVIVTTRNRKLIEDSDAIYEVHTLSDHEAMQLFNQHAFKKEVPDECFKKFSLDVVNQAKGLPLAIKVWGSMLHKKGIDKWEKIVDQIKKKSNSEIVEKLKISYDGLEPEEQKIFLDIACFFRGHKRKQVMKIVESCDFGAEYGLDVLIEKSLVFISKYGAIEMHDLIEDMGKYIVKMQKDSRVPSRIWNVEDFKDVMMGNMETKAVEAIWLWTSTKLSFSKEAMKNMQSLRILGIQTHLWDSKEDSIEYLSNNLCWFEWYKYPWKLLPENFNPKRLVHLDLRWSSLHDLCTETKEFPSLRRLDLSGSKSLKRTPDFRGMPNLEYLNLGQCTSLEEVHHSLRWSIKLIQLNLFECGSLERFPYVNVESLESLNIEKCSSLEKFPGFIGRHMKPELEINMSFSGIRELAFSFFHPQAHRTVLQLRSMNNLVSPPSSICKLKGLVKLNMSYCTKLESLPEDIGNLENLEYLNADYTLISQPPSSIVRLNKLKILRFEKDELEDIFEDGVFFVFPKVNEGLLSLEELNLSMCNLTDGGLPEDIGCLSSLKVLNLIGNNFEYLPGSISQLGALQSLDLSECKKLVALPEEIGDLENLEKLDASGTLISRPPSSIIRLNKLKSLSFAKQKTGGGLVDEVYFVFPQMSEGLRSLEVLDLSYCNLIDGGLPEDIGCLSSLIGLYLEGNNFEHLPRSISQLGSLQYLELSECRRLKQFLGVNMAKGLCSLKHLYLNCCNLIDGGLPEDIGSLSSLEILYLQGNNFEHLPRSIVQLSVLRSLHLSNCKWLTQLPKFPRQLYRIDADWSNDWICNSLFQNISSLQLDISVSHSLSRRVLRSMPQDIPSWFNHQGVGVSVSVNLPQNWYVSDKFLGFAVCYTGKSNYTCKSNYIIAHLIPLCDDGISLMTQKFALSIHSPHLIHFLLVPLGGLWDASNAKGKTPNDYGGIRFYSPGEINEYGVRLLYKDEPELQIRIRKRRYDHD